MHACAVALVTGLPQLPVDLTAGECSFFFQQNTFLGFRVFKRKCDMQVGEGDADAMCAAAS